MPRTTEEDLVLGRIAIGTVADTRSVLFRLAEENKEFKLFMLGRSSPTDAECVQWIIDRFKRVPPPE